MAHFLVKSRTKEVSTLFTRAVSPSNLTSVPCIPLSKGAVLPSSGLWTPDWFAEPGGGEPWFYNGAHCRTVGAENRRTVEL